MLLEKAGWELLGVVPPEEPLPPDEPLPPELPEPPVEPDPPDEPDPLELSGEEEEPPPPPPPQAVRASASRPDANKRLLMIIKRTSLQL